MNEPSGVLEYRRLAARPADWYQPLDQVLGELLGQLGIRGEDKDHDDDAD